MIPSRRVLEAGRRAEPKYKKIVTHNTQWSESRDYSRESEDLDKIYRNGTKLIRLNRAIQIVLASTSKLFLEGIYRVLESNGDIKIVAQASSRDEIEKCLTDIKPKVLLLDNRSLDLDTRKLSKLIAKKGPVTQVILFGDYAEDETAFPNAVYVTKETDSSELIRIIKSLSRGPLTNGADEAKVSKPKFTKMEIKTIDSIAECLSNREIAKKLSISDKTVKAHLSNIFTKLSIQSRYQLIVYARRLKSR